MLQKINDRVINWLIREGSVEEEDRELYQYSMQGILENGITMMVIFIDMIILKSIVQGIVFILSFKYLRRYSGGYHADTYKKCFILSNLLFICAIISIKYNIISIICYRIFGLVSLIILYCIGPVESRNKPLTDSEKQIYYKNEKITICIVMLVCIIMYFMNMADIEKSIESAVILNGVTSLGVVVRRKCNGNIYM